MEPANAPKFQDAQGIEVSSKSMLLATLNVEHLEKPATARSPSRLQGLGNAISFR